MITIKNNQIRLIGYGLLLINIIVFFLTWLRWYIGIPVVIMLLIGSYRLMKDIIPDQREIRISTKTLLLLCGIMLAWTVFSGLGGAFPQKDDMHVRNAILHDLIDYSWPVRYADGLDSSLTYYIAFWLVPSLVGKATNFLMDAQYGWIAANITYTLYCASILCVVLLLLMIYLKAISLKRMLLVATVLIFFSGMDIIPIVWRQLGEMNISLVTHLEWWTNIQYSSNTTQLAWVYNQAIPAWLVTALFLHEQRMDHYAFLGLLLLPYGPLPFIGLFFIMGILAVIEFSTALKQRQLLLFLKQIITPPNILAIVAILPIYYLYYSTNSTTSGSGIGMSPLSKSYFVFVMVEFLIYALLIGRSFWNNNLFRFSVIALFYFPLFALGSGGDFCMRASIPVLFILMIYIMKYLLNNITFCNQGKLQTNLTTILLVICLALGAITPLTEFRQSYTQIIRSGSNRTALIADNLGTLGDGNMERGNFITKHASDSLFYRYIAIKDSSK